jgi:hypothetical protein
MASNNRGPITSFISGLDVDFARPNLFQVDIALPGAGSPGSAIGVAAADVTSLTTLAAFTCKAAQLPASTIGVVEVPFRGRMLKIAGDRTFEPWTITIQNDTAHSLRQMFLQWMDAIQLYEENATRIRYGATPASSPDYLNYMADMRVTQLDRRGNAVVSYIMRQCWPSNVAAIDLDYGSNDAIEEFTVEWQVQYWEPVVAAATTELVSASPAVSPAYTPS